MTITQELRENIIELLLHQDRGATITELNKQIDVERHTLAKYLHVMKEEGILDYKAVGKAKLWFLNKAPLRALLEKQPEERSFLESILADTINRNPLPLFILDQKCNIIFSNRAAKEHYNAHNNFCDLMPGANNIHDIDELIKIVHKDGEEVFTLKDIYGNKLHAHASTIVYPDKEKNLVLMLKPKHALLHDALVEHASAGIIAFDMRGIIQSWNKGAAAHFGHSSEEATGRHISFLLPENEEFKRIVSSITKMEGESYVAERNTIDGLKKFQINISPIVRKNRIIGISHISHALAETDVQYPQKKEESSSVA